VASEQWERLAARLDGVLDRVERLLERTVPVPEPGDADFASSWAFRWQKTGDTGRIVPVVHPHLFDLDDLVGVDHAKDELVRNTAQFVAGASANNVLLWGERGNGKSSCVKGLLNLFAPRGLRLIELQRWDLLSLSAIVGQLRHQPFRFILFCDDLSFAEGEGEYRALKTLLDGGIEERPGNVLIYATSNRRHLMPEYMQENLETKHVGEEIHPGETVEEKVSFSERFGLWISFYPFDQDAYLDIVAHWLRELGCTESEIPGSRQEALQWALLRGARSGRVAWQFARDYAGRNASAGRPKR